MSKIAITHIPGVAYLVVVFRWAVSRVTGEVSPGIKHQNKLRKNLVLPAPAGVSVHHPSTPQYVPVSP